MRAPSWPITPQVFQWSWKCLCADWIHTVELSSGLLNYVPIRKVPLLCGINSHRFTIKLGLGQVSLLEGWQRCPLTKITSELFLWKLHNLSSLRFSFSGSKIHKSIVYPSSHSMQIHNSHTHSLINELSVASYSSWPMTVHPEQEDSSLPEM